MASELQVNTITEATSGSGITFAKDIIPATPLSHRNMIINGAMEVCQRVANDTLVEISSGSGVKAVDRWKLWEGTNGSFEAKQANPLGAIPGFEKTLYLSPNNADTNIESAQYALVGQVIEAQNLTHIGIGTASAKPLTLSFYIKSNLTGTMNAYIAKYNNSRIIPLEFNLPSSAGTWERIELTAPALTSGGIIANSNGLGFEVIWALALGSTFKIGTNGTWGSNNNGLGTSNHNVNFMSSTSNYIEITGVQLELGSVATPFEHRSYADELTRCERYYQNSFNEGNVPGTSTSNTDSVITTGWNDGNAPFINPFRTVMRSAPTVTLRPRGSTSTGQVNNDGTNKNTTATDISNKGVSYLTVSSGTANVYNAYSYELQAEL